MWTVETAPADGTPRLGLASDGTPNGAVHAGCVHLGAIGDAITTTVKPKADPLSIDAFDGPVFFYVTDMDAKIEATLAQITLSLLQRALGVGTYASGAGYKQLTFGGTVAVPEVCVAAISPKRAAPAKHVISLLFKAVATGGFSFGLGRSKPASLKIVFQGLADPARTVGKQMGIIHETLADAAGGTPTAKALAVADIQQGPCDLWLVSAAPLDAAVRPTLAADLTPDSATHAASAHLGATMDGVTVTVTPKIELGRIDNCEGAVYATLQGIEASIEAEMTQSEMAKLNRALGVGSYSTDDVPGPATYKQATFGGTSAPAEICVAAIAPKRSDTTKAVGACLYKVSATEGIQVIHTRSKPSTYKVKFSAMVDPTRTAGKQMGVIWETA